MNSAVRIIGWKTFSITLVNSFDRDINFQELRDQSGHLAIIGIPFGKLS